MALKDAVATVLNRNAFYRDGYRMLLRVSLIQLVVILFLVASLVGMVLLAQTKQVYFATTSDGRIIPIVPLSEQFRSDADVAAWATIAAQNIMRFDYNDYVARLQQVQSDALFTETGWESFNKALKDSTILELAKARKLVVSLNMKQGTNSGVVFTNTGVHTDSAGVLRYTWDMRFPIIIKFDGAEPPQPISATLLLRIVRVSTLQNSNGIGIEQWVTATPDSK
jgi:intracellular multiplication protein IcmL